MALLAKNESDFQICPEGTTLGCCIWVIDLGMQHNERYNKDQHKVLLGWELPELIIEGTDKPFMISRSYTITMDDRGDMRKLLDSWRGKGFTDEELENGYDLKLLLGQWGYLSIVHSDVDGKTYANVSMVIGLPDKARAEARKIKTVNERLYLELAAGEFDQNVFDKLPDWVKKKIYKSEEWANLQSGGSDDTFDDDSGRSDYQGSTDPDDLPF